MSAKVRQGANYTDAELTAIADVVVSTLDKRTIEKLGWLMAAAHSESDECIEWPGADNGQGYGQVNLAGRREGTHRLALAFAAPFSPSPPSGTVKSAPAGH